MRLLSGFAFIGFAIVFWAFFTEELAASFIGQVAFYGLVGLSLVVGISLVLFHRAVVIDPLLRQASQVVFLHRVVVHRRVWPFQEFQCIVVRHATDEGSAFSSVSLKLSSGSEVWLRSFGSPPVGLSEEATSFINNLVEATGLRYEEMAG